MSVTIREATAADFRTILTIIERLAEFELPAKRTPEMFWSEDAKLFEAVFNGTAPNSFAHVACDSDGTILGVTLVTLREEFFDHSPSAHLEVIAVAHEADGRGIGKQLMAHAETEARKRGAGSLSLHVVVNNHRARHVYKKIGFTEELIRCIKHFD